MFQFLTRFAHEFADARVARALTRRAEPARFRTAAARRARIVARARTGA